MNPTLVLAAVRHRRLIFKVAAILCGLSMFLMLGPVWVLLATSGNAGQQQVVGDFTGCTVVDGQDVATPAGLDGEQTKNAATVIAVAKGLSVPPKGWTIAIAVTLVESNLYNLDHGDRDSLGLFQQRPSAGWGTPAEITDPVKATQAFYGRASHTNNTGLLDIPGWQDMPLSVAAQRVQRSAFPDAYGAREQQAVNIVAALSGVTAGLCTEQATGTGPWRAPLAKGSYTITSGFGVRWGRLHAGVDLAAPIGTPIYAASEGTVTTAGAASGYGQLVEIDHGGVKTRYGHVSAIFVKVGQHVAVGAHIANVGNEGRSTGPHLHFETRPNDVPTDPIPFMRAKGVTL